MSSSRLYRYNYLGRAVITAAAGIGGISGGVRYSSASAGEGTKQSFDCVVIGAGSGGIAFAKRAASYGASVAVIEGKKYGGKLSELLAHWRYKPAMASDN